MIFYISLLSKHMQEGMLSLFTSMVMPQLLIHTFKLYKPYKTQF